MRLLALRLLACLLASAGLLVLDGPGYPHALASIHDPPQVLSVLGGLCAEDVRAVAVVGARRASLEGREIAYRLGAELAAARAV